MASVSFSDHICEMDSDYENMEECEPGHDSIVQLDSESTAISQTCPDSLQIEVFRHADNDQMQRHRWSAATLRVISSMPSVTASRNSTEAFSRRSRSSSHVRQTNPTSSCASSHLLRPVREDPEEISSEDDRKEKLVVSLRGLSISDRMRKLRAMPLSLADKMELRRLAFSEVAASSLMSRNLPCCSSLRACTSRTWRHCRFGCLGFLGSLQLWHTPMKMLSGRFGTGVLSYFLFLRTLLCFNLFLFIVIGLFVVFPQLVQPPQPGPGYGSFKGHDLLLGTGYFSHSVMFYGYYTNATTYCQPDGSAAQSHNLMGCMQYNIPAAYLFTIIVTFFVTFICLVYSMSKLLGKRLHILKSNRNLAVKVFCSWDFKVSKKTSVRLQCQKISTQLKELLSDLIRGEDKKTCKQICCSLVVHLLTWLMCLSSICMSTAGVHLLSKNTIKSPHDEMKLLLLPAVVSGVNLLLPGLFNLSAWVERSHSPSTRVYISICRNLLLKVSIVAVLCYRWLGKIAEDPGKYGVQCWESFVGQELYRLLLMDFIFTVLYTLMGEFLWRLFTKHVLKRKRKPVFDIARNVLELIYGQTLTWLGILFAPLLPAVQILKLFLLFYMKKSSLMLNCQVSRKPWLASQMSTLFLCLLCFPSFFGAVISVAYAMGKLKPSPGCGPFRDLNSMFNSGKQWSNVILVEYPLLLFLASGVFVLVIYFYAQVVDGQKKIISQLEKQIENEGNDKNFLILKLQELYERDGLASSHS